MIQVKCSGLKQVQAAWDLCRIQKLQGNGFVCELSGDLFNDQTLEDSKADMGYPDVVVRTGDRSRGPLVVISNVEEVRSRARKAMQQMEILKPDALDRIVEESIGEEMEEMVADDAKKGEIPVRLVRQAKGDERKYIEKMRVFEVVDRREAQGKRVIGTRWVVTNKGTAENPNVRAR